MQEEIVLRTYFTPAIKELSNPFRIPNETYPLLNLVRDIIDLDINPIIT